jgi:hypothetical protein
VRLDFLLDIPLDPLDPLEIDLIRIGLFPLSSLFYSSVLEFLSPRVVILIPEGLLSRKFLAVLTISSDSIALGISSIILGGDIDFYLSDSLV